MQLYNVSKRGHTNFWSQLQCWIFHLTLFTFIDNIPAEIFARGPEAVDAYIKLRKEGNAPLFRGRLFLVGQDSSRPFCNSSSRLKSALFGDRPSSMPTFESTSDSIIECHHFCRINSKGQWKLHCRDLKAKKASNSMRPLYLEGCIELTQSEIDIDAYLATCW